MLFTIHPVVLTDVFLQPPSGKLLLFFAEPAGGSREVGQNEDGDGGNNDGDCTLDDEKPAPVALKSAICTSYVFILELTKHEDPSCSPCSQ